MFSGYCQNPNTVEKCEVETQTGQVSLYPTLGYRQEIVHVDKLNRLVGIDETAANIADLLSRMCLCAEADSHRIKVHFIH